MLCDCAVVMGEGHKASGYSVAALRLTPVPQKNLKGGNGGHRGLLVPVWAGWLGVDGTDSSILHRRGTFLRA